MARKKLKWYVNATQNTEEGQILEYTFENRSDAWTFADYALGSKAIEKGLTPTGPIKLHHFQSA